MLRALLALCAALSLVAPAHVVHYLVVQHEVCSEHGELVHADGAEHGIVSAAAAQAPEVGAAARTPAIDAAPQRHEHEHCACAAPAREALALPPAHAALTIAAASSEALLDTTHPGAAASEALFRLAPKTSPPL